MQNNIKVGQIYEIMKGEYFVISLVSGYPECRRYHIIKNNGSVYDDLTAQDIKECYKFVKEYPTWQEAVKDELFTPKN